MDQVLKRLSGVAAGVLAVVLMAGCASKPDAATIAKDEAKLEAARNAAAAKRVEARNEALEANLKKVPEWVLVPPRADGEFVYAVGEGKSPSLAVARDMATLLAEFNLAKRYQDALSGQERASRQGYGAKVVEDRYSLLVDRLVDRVPLRGQEVIKSEVVVMDGQYVQWVLMKLSFDQMERILRNQRAGLAKDEMAADFDALEKRLKAYREEQRNAAAAGPATKAAEAAAKPGADVALVPAQ